MTSPIKYKFLHSWILHTTAILSRTTQSCGAHCNQVSLQLHEDMSVNHFYSTCRTTHFYIQVYVIQHKRCMLKQKLPILITIIQPQNGQKGLIWNSLVFSQDWQLSNIMLDITCVLHVCNAPCTCPRLPYTALIQLPYHQPPTMREKNAQQPHCTRQLKILYS